MYGNNFWSKTLTDAQIVAEIANVNKDYQGLQADYATVNNNFASIKSPMDISFELAKKDPNGNPTTGIDRKTTTGADYGNGTPPSQLALDAWDNKKYMNVYIVADLYNDGGSTNSGVAWYPAVSMTNAKTARVVYNGQYVGSNTSAEFRSVLTHEFGHFMNLAHTFDTGCSGTGDGVTDTPLHSSTSLGCPTNQTSNTPVSDCGNWVINSENFMDYNGAFCGYKNFTKGQVARMDATLNLNDVTRFPLWQTSNLIITGLLDPSAIEEVNSIEVSNIFPNPSLGVSKIEINVNKEDTYTLEITNVVGQVMYSKNLGNINGTYQTQIDITGAVNGVYLLSVRGADAKKVVKLIKQ